MKSFQRAFCEAHRCSEDAFAQTVFRRCLHRHALPLAPLLGGLQAKYFAADRDLIVHAGRAPATRIYEAISRWRPALMGGCRGVALAPLVTLAGFTVSLRENFAQMLFPSEVIAAIRN